MWQRYELGNLPRVMTDDQKTAALSTFTAYNAMETTKRRHFDFLSRLDAAKQNLRPTFSGGIAILERLRNEAL